MDYKVIGKVENFGVRNSQISQIHLGYSIIM